MRLDQKLKQKGITQNKIDEKIQENLEQKQLISKYLQNFRNDFSKTFNNSLEKLPRFQPQIPAFPRYDGQISQEFLTLQRILLKINKNLCDIDTFTEAFLYELASLQKRTKNFALEGKVLRLLRKFLNGEIKFPENILQKGLADNFLDDEKKEHENSETFKEIKEDFHVKLDENIKGERRNLLDILNFKGGRKLGLLKKIKERGKKIKDIEEKFNYWMYWKKKKEKKIF